MVKSASMCLQGLAIRLLQAHAAQLQSTVTRSGTCRAVCVHIVTGQIGRCCNGIWNSEPGREQQHQAGAWQATGLGSSDAFFPATKVSVSSHESECCEVSMPQHNGTWWHVCAVLLLVM